MMGLLEESLPIHLRDQGYAHKLKDEDSGRFAIGQSIVFLVVDTPKATILAGFVLYMLDPAMTRWNKQQKALKKMKIPGINLCPDQSG